MTSRSRIITGGVDTHSTVHEAAVLDQQGRLLGVATFPATRQGYEQLLAWMRRFGRVERVGVEGTSSYGADLTRHLQAAGITVVEVNQPTPTPVTGAARATRSTPRPQPARCSPASAPRCPKTPPAS